MLAMANKRSGYDAADQETLESLAVAIVEALMRKRTEEARRASERKLRTISDASLDAVVMMDSAGKVVHWNPAAQQMFGYRAEELLGRDVHQTLAPARYRAGALASMAHFARSGQGAALGKIVELEGLRRDGTEFPIELAVAPIQLDDQWWAVATIRDITQRKKSEMELRRYNEELVFAKTELEKHAAELAAQTDELQQARRVAETASRAKSAFLASMSHELRTPMNSIMGFTQRLLERLEGSIAESDLDALQTVDRNAQQLLALINDVLEITKIEAGKIELRSSQFDVGDVVREVTQRLGPSAERKGLPLQMDLREETTRIHADRERTTQIVTHLVSNAIKYTHQGYVAIAADRFDDPQIGPAVRIRVSDTGIGIRPEDREKLFVKLTQLDEGFSRRAGGTGLGLCIAAECVRMHEGRIDVDSEPGVGSTFTVVLPKGECTQSPAPRAAGGSGATLPQDPNPTADAADTRPESGPQLIGNPCLRPSDYTC
jgi:PAS domain S-box-containing protein